MKSLCSVVFLAWFATWLALTAPAAAQQRVRRPDDAAVEKVRQQKLEAISTIVKGVCLDGATGKPLAGVQVRVDAWDRGARGAPAELVKPATEWTGEDGSFAVRVLARKGAQVSFEASLAGRWPRTGRWKFLLADVVENVGEVRLYPGRYALARVVDESGQPMPGVRIAIDKLRLFVGSENAPAGPRRAAAGGLARECHWAANDSRSAVSDEDGGFRSRVPLPVGTFPLRVMTRGLSLVEPMTLTIAGEERADPPTIVVREQPFLSGTVVDQKGQPVVGVTLEARFRRRGAGRIASGTSKKDGSFKIYRVNGAPETVTLRLINPGPCERQELRIGCTWGQTGIRIALRRALQIDVRVIEAGSGKPVEAFGIRAFSRKRGTQVAGLGTRLAGQHADGRLRVDRVPHGDSIIVIVPEDPQLQVVEAQVLAGPDTGLVTVETRRLVPLLVQVLDAAGQPVENATVLVVQPGDRDHPFARSAGIYDPRTGSGGARGVGKFRLDTQTHRASTDSGGQCLVYGIAGRTDHELLVRVGDAEPHRVPDVAFGAGGGSRSVQLGK